MSFEKSVPDSINGVPLAYKYDEKLCIIKKMQPDYATLNLGDNLMFVQEPNNPYDKKAIAVYDNDSKIGYLYKGKLQDTINDFIRRGDAISAYIKSIDVDKPEIMMFIGLYKEVSPYWKLMHMGAPFKTYKLTGNKSDEMQEAIGFIDDYSDVGYLYDYDKEKYMASSDYGDLGYFPKSANQYLDDECEAYVVEIADNDAEKLDITVAVFTN